MKIPAAAGRETSSFVQRRGEVDPATACGPSVRLCHDPTGMSLYVLTPTQVLF